MKTIEITTAHNVTIKYNLATLLLRSVAFFIDLVIIFVAGGILNWFLSLFIPFTDLVIYFTLLPVFFLYSLCWEIFNNGKSPGKMLLKIRVIRIDGEPVQFLDFFLRWVFRSVDIYGGLGSIAALSVLISTRSQRLGDLLGDTVVVQVSLDSRLKLDNLMKLNTLNKYTPRYPGVIRLSEENMLLIKEVIARYKKYNNKAHDLALNATARKVANELSVTRPKNDLEFLQVLLKDYISLSR